MRELRPTPRLRAVLRRVNTVRFPLSVLGRSHGRVMPMTRHVVSRRLNLAAITTPATSHYRRAVAEMVRAFRTETGEPLGPALLLAVRKWANSGLDPDLLQELACDLFDRFEAAGRLPPRPKGVAPAPRQRRRPKRTYEQSLGRGRTTHARAFPAEVQAASHGQAIAANREISRKLAALLKARGIPGRQFIRYNAFAQKLGRLSRNYSSRTLARAAADLVDQYETKSLDHSTLIAIAFVLFGIAIPSAWRLPSSPALLH